MLDLLQMDELIPISEIDILARDIEQSRDRWSINGLCGFSTISSLLY